MKKLIIIFNFCCILTFGQNNTNKSFFQDSLRHKYEQIPLISKLSLEDIPKTNFDVYYRISKYGQIVDVWSDSIYGYGGAITNYLYIGRSWSDSITDTLSQILFLTEEEAKLAYGVLNSVNKDTSFCIDSISSGNGSSLKSVFLFEKRDVNDFLIKSIKPRISLDYSQNFYNPQNDKLLDLYFDIVDSLSKILKLNERKDFFIAHRAPYGYFYDERGMKTGYSSYLILGLKGALNLNYGYSAQLGVMLRRFTIQSKLSHQFDGKGSFDFQGESTVFWYDTKKAYNKLYPLTFGFRYREIKFAKENNSYSNYWINCLSYKSFNFGFEYLDKSKEDRFGFKIKYFHGIEKLSLYFSSGVTLYSDQAEFYAKIDKDVYLFSGNCQLIVGLMFEKTLNNNDVSFSLVVPISLF